MAINKKKASPIVKIGIIIVAILLVVAFAVPAGFSLFSGTDSDTSTGDSGQLEAIAASYVGTVDAYEGLLASDPTSYTVLVNMANVYSDWADSVLQYQGGPGAADQPMWLAASVYYAHALGVQPGDPNVETDMAIALFYGGDLQGAIDTIIATQQANPDFAPAFYNAMVFYNTAGRTAEAVAAATRYLELDPQGTVGNVEAAQRTIDEAPEGLSVPAETSPTVEATTAP